MFTYVDTSCCSVTPLFVYKKRFVLDSLDLWLIQNILKTKKKWFKINVRVAMDFAELIITPKLDGVILHNPGLEPIDGTLCITGHHMILSSRKEDVQELWVRWFLDIIFSL